MTVPPSDRRPSSTPPGKQGPEDSKKTDKPFHLPGERKEGVEEGIGEKKKGLFDLKSDDKSEEKKKKVFDMTSGEVALQSKQQGLQENIPSTVGEVQATAKIASAAVAQVSQVGALIQKMVETMHVGQVGGKDFATLNLKTSVDVPPAFANSNLTVSYKDNGITIHFDNFMTPQQQNQAINLVEKNKEQLVQMVQTLNAKNIQVKELTIGSHVVALPHVEGRPAPFQPILTAETERGRRREEQVEPAQREPSQREPE
jgi:hypothetical protein